MFYSHTFLARKSPLGTVWIAAHLQHKLRKSHVSVTDISSSVDCIMFPEVPIALRLSGHLLLGVVRIYSKKVDYLYHDCNEVLTRLRNAFASVQLNLPEDANHAPFHSVTLPDTFELDALDLDDMIYQAEAPDNHLKTHDQITLTDQIPGEGDSYVAFFINEHSRMDSSPAELPNSSIRPAAEDVLPPFPMDRSMGVTDPGPSNYTEELNQSSRDDHFTQELPEIEVLRDAVHSFGTDNLPEWSEIGNDNIELLGPFDQTMNEKENLSPIIEGISVSGGESLPSQLHPKLPTVTSPEAPEVFGSRISLGLIPSEFAIQPTPPVEKQKPKSRKRKQFFDKSLVLTNDNMKEQLNNTSKLVQKRRKLPCSALDIWKSNMSLRMEQIFLEPLVSGMCTSLQENFKKGSFASKVIPISLTEAPPENCDPQTPIATPHIEMEIEHPRFEKGVVDGSLPELMPSPSIQAEFIPFSASSIGAEPHIEMEIEHPRFEKGVVDSSLTDLMPSPSIQNEFSSFSASTVGAEPQTGKTLEFEILPTLEVPSSAEPVGSELETPMDRFDRELFFEDTNLPDIPEMPSPSEVEDLDFLEADSPQAGFDGHEENEENEVHTLSLRATSKRKNTLSVRTRAVAQYLQNKSLATPISNNQHGTLSLNRILEGKKRKQCARMFMETLVLKSYGLINLQQEEAYGDIIISLTSTISKAKS